MLAKVAFLHTTDERLIVLSEIVQSSPRAQGTRFTVTTFDHENTFLKLAATAGLAMELTTDIISAVLLSVAQPTFPHRWVDLDISVPEIASLGLLADSVDAAFLSDPSEGDHPQPAILGHIGSGEHFRDFLMQAPTPFVMLSGPEHRMTFINPPYLRLIGRSDPDELLGKTIREIFHELHGTPFFGLLDRVFRTGVAYTGIEVPATLQAKPSGGYRDSYVDFVYHPLRDDDGEVCGIMVQAADVTDRVLSREAANSRENQIYQQWIELEAIYKTAPVGVMLCDARHLRIVRINDMQAEFLGSTACELQGKRMNEISSLVPAFHVLLERVMHGTQVRNTIIEAASTEPAHERRAWLVNISAILDQDGSIDRLCTISLEMPARHASPAPKS